MNVLQSQTGEERRGWLVLPWACYHQLKITTTKPDTIFTKRWMISKLSNTCLPYWLLLAGSRARSCGYPPIRITGAWGALAGFPRHNYDQTVC